VLHRFLPRLRTLPAGRYIWLSSATDLAGNTTNGRPRSVLVFKR
jgi:hypothetical protein